MVVVTLSVDGASCWTTGLVVGRVGGDYSQKDGASENIFTLAFRCSEVKAANIALTLLLNDFIPET